MQSLRMLICSLACLALTPAAHGQLKAPPYKPIDKATIAAYKKIGGNLGEIRELDWAAPSGPAFFADIPRNAPKSIPLFGVEDPRPGTKYPDVDVPFGLMIYGYHVRNNRLKELAHLKNLKVLMLWTTPGLSPAGLKNLAPLKNLDTLILDIWTISDDHLRALREVNLLHALAEATARDGARARSADEVVAFYFRRMWVTDKGLKELAPFKNLEKIYFHFEEQGPPSGVTNAGLKELARFEKLKEVHFDYLNAEGLKNLAAVKSLAVLDLGDAYIKDADLKVLVPCQNLTSLTLGKTITDAGLKNLPTLKNLAKLDLYRTKVTDAGFKELARFDNLAHLSLWSSQASERGVQELASLKKLSKVTLHDAGDEELKRVARLTNLTALSLSDPEVTAAGLKELARLPRLTALSLEGYKIEVTDAQMKELAAMKNLASLSLDDLFLEDTALPRLARLTNLRELDLSRTGVTKAGIAQLQKALPNCKILR